MGPQGASRPVAPLRAKGRSAPGRAPPHGLRGQSGNQGMEFDAGRHCGIFTRISTGVHSLWARLEGAVRDLARSDGEVYVLTGPIYHGERVQRLQERVAVPTQIYKAVYDPVQHAAGVYLVDNAPGNDWQVISVAELRELTGLDVFPKLEQMIKDHAMALPGPSNGVP